MAQVALEAPCSSALGIWYQHQSGRIPVTPMPKSDDTEPGCNETNGHVALTRFRIYGAATGYSNHTLKPVGFLLHFYYTLYTYP